MRKKITITPKQLQDFRLSLNLNRSEFADLIGVTTVCILHWESCNRSIPETTARLVLLFKKFPQLIQEF